MRIECRHVRVRRGDRVVLAGIDLSISSEECVALIGPNGSGKTTLLLAIMGLLPLDGGSILFDGTDIRRIPPRRRGLLAAYVPQVVEHIPAFRVCDVVAGGRFPHVSPLRPLSQSDHEAVQAALRRCGLESLAQRPIHEVSGGERQKALIAAAIAQEARVMCLDEPNTALDPAYQVELLSLLRDWHAHGRGVVVVSHDLQLPSAVATRVVALREGRMVADGPPPEVLSPERLTAVYGADFETALTSGGRRVVLPRWER
jgi:iron complex transport system ATP-binding protein